MFLLPTCIHLSFYSLFFSVSLSLSSTYRIHVSCCLMIIYIYIYTHTYIHTHTFPSPGDLPNPGIKPGSPILQADALPSEPPGKPIMFGNKVCIAHSGNINLSQECRTSFFIAATDLGSEELVGRWLKAPEHSYCNVATFFFTKLSTACCIF